MIQCRKGIISMPIKLIVSFLIISLMVPPIVSMAEDIRDEIDDTSIMDSAGILKDRISKVHSKGSEFRMQTDLEIPKNGHLEIGGEEGMVIRVYKDDDHIGNVILDCCIVCDDTVLYGDVILRISNCPGGVEVREL